ncbi:hypothetical protein [Bacillus sp. FJAT-49736]|uniref:hypothetical protein n=1 Tax=Bacillus sp. FJAT-49736 TaxID=2833582 RepID=UPI001BC9E2E6|nr:hypothetical protein [Bacillus sp. FJAT-49736]MBS4173489.1 hypothetical protein [Bacillus sp. FJAT-49736]
MTDEMKKNLELRRKIRDLACEIDGHVDHGECFYEEDMLAGFCKTLDRMKELAQEYYASNKREMEMDEE